MSNPLYQQLNGNRGMSFPQFMAQMRGQDPNAIINNMLMSGQLTQQQLNQVQAQAAQLGQQLSGFKSMFGF